MLRQCELLKLTRGDKQLTKYGVQIQILFARQSASP